MFKTLLAAVAALTLAVPAQAQNVRFGVTIGNPGYNTYRQDHNGYLQCYRPNGRIGIVTDYYGRPVTRYTARYQSQLFCSKIRSTRTYDDRYEGYHRGRQY